MKSTLLLPFLLCPHRLGNLEANLAFFVDILGIQFEKNIFGGVEGFFENDQVLDRLARPNGSDGAKARCNLILDLSAQFEFDRAIDVADLILSGRPSEQV